MWSHRLHKDKTPQQCPDHQQASPHCSGVVLINFCLDVVVSHLQTHEILHAIGFWHEQSRYDRDTYVTVDTTKVRDGYAHNYYARSPQDIENVGTYDYASVMHYGTCSFATDCNGLGAPMSIKEPYFSQWLAGTFGKNPGLTRVGHGISLSPIDITDINTIYSRCLDSPDPTCPYMEVSGSSQVAGVYAYKGQYNDLGSWEKHSSNGKRYLWSSGSRWRISDQLGGGWKISESTSWSYNVPPSGSDWAINDPIEVQCAPGM